MKEILIIQTGGTIAMHLDEGKPELDQDKFHELLKKEMPELSTIANLNMARLFSEDSSEITPKHWTKLSRFIESSYEQYDGFVVLHGTDTMAYTASALSFSMINLGKPIIFTGSQVPMSNIRSDARRNVVNAVELATHPIYEVAICFNDRLFRGNRSSKMSIGDFDAFSSPNFPPIAQIGTDIELSKNQKKPVDDLICNPKFSDSIRVVKLFPGLNPGRLQKPDPSNTKAIIFETFGSGNFPVKEENSMLPFMKECRDKGCHVIITSQAAYDAVNLNLYASGRHAKKLGALSAGDMTMEATITKTMYLLGIGLEDEEFKSQFITSIAGERSR